MPHLKLDQSLVNEARALALHIGEPSLISLVSTLLLPSNVPPYA